MIQNTISFLKKQELIQEKISNLIPHRRFTSRSFTKGYIINRTQQPSSFYNIKYYLGKKREYGIQYSDDGSYLNPHSSTKYKFIDLVNWIQTNINHGKVLDVGSGPGHLNYWAKKLKTGFKVIGCDISKDLINSKYNLNDEYIICSATNLTFKDNTFEAIIFSDILEHLLPEEVIASLQEAKRVLKPGGYVFIRIPNRITWNNKTYNDQAHVWLPSIKELQNLLVSSGFSSSSIKHFTRGFPGSSIIFKFFHKDLRLARFGTAINIKAKKES